MKRTMALLCAGALLCGLTACTSDEVKQEGLSPAAGGVQTNEAASAETSEAQTSAAQTTTQASSAKPAPDENSVTIATGQEQSPVDRLETVDYWFETEEEYREREEFPETTEDIFPDDEPLHEDDPDGAEIPLDEYIPLSAEDVYVYIEDENSLTTDTESFTLQVEYRGDAASEYCFGTYYTLKKEDETQRGVWHEVPFSENKFFNDIGLIINSEYPRNSISVSLSDRDYAQPLTAGIYCVDIELCDGVKKSMVFAVNEAYIPLSEGDILVEFTESEYYLGTDSVRIRLTYVGEDSGAGYDIGSSYSLEKWNDGWQSVPFAENAAFTLMAYQVGGGIDSNEITLGISDDMFAQPLTGGRYRITKSLCDGVSAQLEFELLVECCSIEAADE